MAIVDARYGADLYVGPRYTDIARPGFMATWSLDEVAALLLAECPREHDDETVSWSECHAQLATNADVSFRRAGITIAHAMGDAETVADLSPSMETNFTRALRELDTPRSK